MQTGVSRAVKSGSARSPGQSPVPGVTLQVQSSPRGFAEILQNCFPVGPTDNDRRFRYDARTFSEQKAF